MGNKNVEQKCLDIAKHLSKNSKLQGNDTRIEQEKPDFVFGTVGIEHFVADVIFPKTAKTNAEGLYVVDSIHRKQSNEISNTVKHYRENETELEKDIQDGKAPQFVEDIVQRQLDCMRDFNCNVFISNFERVFNHHYEQVDVYVNNNNLTEIGFLIEIPYLDSLYHKNFWIESKGIGRMQNISSIPFPQRIVDLFIRANKLDFIYIVLYPLNFNNNYRKCKFLTINPTSAIQDLRRQHIVVCDSFKYPKLDIDLKLNVEKTD